MNDYLLSKIINKVNKTAVTLSIPVVRQRQAKDFRARHVYKNERFLLTDVFEFQGCFVGAQS